MNRKKFFAVIESVNHRFSCSKLSKIVSLISLSIVAASANSQTLEEIVVTGQLRDENLQDVPIEQKEQTKEQKLHLSPVG